MTKAKEERAKNYIDSLVDKYKLNDKDYLFAKDIYKVFGISRQLLHTWCKDENKALDFVWHNSKRRKYPTCHFIQFYKKLAVTGVIPIYCLQS